MPLNPLHFNPDLPEAFCDAIAELMDKNPDHRTPTAAAVVDLLRPWCDPNATKNLAGASPTASGMFYRISKSSVAPMAPPLEETASFVLDEADPAPGQIESPSQISQGTVRIAGETEETLPHMPTPRKTSAPPGADEGIPPRRILTAAIVAVVLAVVGVVIALLTKN
jgi:hypothetical protein